MTASHRIAVLAVLLLFVSPARAAEYPSTPIRIVVPFPAGGSIDIAARLLASAMATRLNQSIVIENRPGGGGVIGMSAVATSGADGYTLLATSSSYSIATAGERAAGRRPAFEPNQLAPIALISANAPVLMVRGDAAWRTARQFIEDAARRPGTISYASTGINSTPHLAMELLARDTRVTLKHVPFRGMAPALTALMAGEVDATLAVTSSALAEHIRNGRLAPILVMGDRRLGALPDVPTTHEIGYRGAEMYFWTGLFAPAGTPGSVIRTLSENVRRVMSDSAVRHKMEMVGLTPDFRADAEFREFLATDASRVAIALGAEPARVDAAPSVTPMPAAPSSSSPSVMPLPKEPAPSSAPSVMPLPTGPSR